MIIGIIGSVTGIAGAIMGYVSYQRSNKFKTLDLYLELRKALNNFNSDVKKARELNDKANKSRLAVNAARGIGVSFVLRPKKRYFC
jgi:hypothetical protein